MSLTEFEKGMIVAFREAGWTNTKISQRINRLPTTISGFYCEFKKTGRIERKPGSGRKRKTTERENTDILIAAKRQRKITTSEIKIQLKLSISERTIRNRLNENGFYSYFTVKKPFISEKNRKARLKFARDHKDKPVEFWRKVLWSDESPFVLRFQGKERVWRLANERLRSVLHARNSKTR
jgi:transposase